MARRTRVGVLGYVIPDMESISSNWEVPTHYGILIETRGHKFVFRGVATWHLTETFPSAYKMIRKAVRRWVDQKLLRRVEAFGAMQLVKRDLKKKHREAVAMYLRVVYGWGDKTK